MAAHQDYPLRLEGRLEGEPSRWLWLVKWLLAIPHYIVLAFLWIAFFVLTVVALLRDPLHARYPRGIFDFNVGVLRWTWRVAFYSYGALGTDRYPPFSLGEEPDYPATLDVAYPERLSRGLVLVKWWLLAIPHYLVLGLLLGGGSASGTRRRLALGMGLELASAPGSSACSCSSPASRCSSRRATRAGIFDFVLGLDRWVARVAAYAGLMTDAYPPFRLDQGGEDAPVAPPEAPPSPAAAVGEEPPLSRRRPRAPAPGASCCSSSARSLRCSRS